MKKIKTILASIITILLIASTSYALNVVQLTPEYFPNPTIGRALSNAKIYVGIVDLDPEISANQKQISVQQENGSIVQVSQPLSTGKGGVPLYNGSPVTILVDGVYSLKVTTSSGSQIYYVPSSGVEDAPTLQAEDIAALKLIDDATDGQMVVVSGYFDPGDDGGGVFYWDSLSSEPPDDCLIFKVTSLTVGRFKRLTDGSINMKMCGATGLGIEDDTAECQAAIDTGLPILETSSALYLIDPSIGLNVIDGTTIEGAGQTKTGFLAKYNTAGSVIKRVFNAGIPNDRIQQVELSDFSVFLNHLQGSSEPANIQQGFNFRDIGRSRIINCYSGNFRFGTAATLFPNAVDKTEAMWGYPFVLGNRSAADVDYAGGEVNKIINCRSWWARKGITLDDQDLTGGVSASYNAIIKGNDIQTVEVGINQGSQFNVGCTFEDNLIQDVQAASGSTNDIFVYSLAGADLIVKGGYVETDDTKIDACIHFASTANNNEVLPFHHDISDAKFVQDDSSVGSKNFIRQITETDDFKETLGGINFKQTENKAKVTFDAAGTILENMNVTSVTRNGVGDFSIVVPLNIGITANTMPEVTILSNASGNVTAHTIRTVSVGGSSITYRIRTWNVNLAADEDFPQVWFSVKG